MSLMKFACFWLFFRPKGYYVVIYFFGGFSTVCLHACLWLFLLVDFLQFKDLCYRSFSFSPKKKKINNNFYVLAALYFLSSMFCFSLLVNIAHLLKFQALKLSDDHHLNEIDCVRLLVAANQEVELLLFCFYDISTYLIL